MRIASAGIWILLLAAGGRADTYVRQPSVDVVHYDISVELNDTSDSLAGTTKINVLMRDEKVTGMWLDFADMHVDELLVGGEERRFTSAGGRLVFDFDRTYSRGEIAVIEVRYHGKTGRQGVLIEKNQYGHTVIFTDNWPDRAHYWFPSIDHPSDKATVDVTVTAPDKYDVVSNGRLIKTVSLLDGRKTTQWTESKAIPTYCVAIGAAEFSISHQEDVAGVPVDWYSYPQDAEAAAQKFSRTVSALIYFSSLIGPYPYEKLAQVQSTTRMGGMENASAIFYGESSFRKVPVPENPVPHEIAHQWFGDSVTEADWDHIWLSEGFATYFDALFHEHVNGQGSLKKTMDDYAKYLASYPSARLSPVIDPGQTDVMKKLNPVNYQKGAWILHMLRGMLGDVPFFEGIRRYYRQYEGGNVLSDDFRNVMQSVSGIELGDFFRQWLYQPGWPEYSVSWHWDEGAREVKLSVRQVQATGLFDMPLEIAFLVGDRQEVRKFRIDSAAREFRVPLAARPASVEIDPGGWVLKSVDSRQSSVDNQ